MNLMMPKFRVRDAQNKTALVCQENCLDLLQTEAENIRKWQVRMEIKLKEKEKDLSNCKKTADNLRKSLLEAKMENEKTAEQLRVELKRRDSRFEKLESTRTMCILVKDEFTRLEETLNICTATADRLREENEKKNVKIQKLTDDFTEVKASIKECWEDFGREHSKFQASAKEKLDEVVAQRETAKSQIMTANEQLHEMEITKEKLEVTVSSLEDRVTSLNFAKGKMQNTLYGLLETIGELKRDSEATAEELQTRLSAALEVVDEKTRAIRDLNDQYTEAKEGWQQYEEKYQAAIKSGEREVEKLVLKLEDCVLQKDLQEKQLHTAVGERAALANEKEHLESKIERMEQVTKEKQGEFEELQRQCQDQTRHKQSLTVEFEARVESLEAMLREKTRESVCLSAKVNKLERDLADVTAEAELTSGEVRKTREALKVERNKVDDLEQEKAKLVEENGCLESKARDVEDLESQLTEAKKLLDNEAKKMKKVSDECQRREKKAEENGKKKQGEIKKLQDEVKAKEKELKRVALDHETLKKGYAVLRDAEDEHKQEREKLLAEIQGMVKSRDEQQSDTERKTADLAKELENTKEALHECQRDLHSYKELLRDTEKMLQEEGEKMLSRKDKIEDQEKLIGDLRYELELKNLEISDVKKQMLNVKEKLEECTSPHTFQVKPHHQHQPEVKRIKEEQKPNIRETIEPKTRRPDRKFFSILNDTAEDLPSEVSFGSGVMDAYTFNRKRSRSSSTPKQPTVPPNVKFISHKKNTPHLNPKKQAANRNSKGPTRSGSGKKSGAQKV